METNVTTIAESVQQYNELKNALSSDTTKELYSIAIDSAKPGTYFNNGTYLHALLLTSLMLERTQKHIKIFAGEFFSEFYSHLKDDFQKVIERITSKNIQIIITKKIDDISRKAQELSQLESKYNELKEIGIPIRFCFSYKHLPHFYLIDDYMLRIEDAHEPRNLDSLSDSVNAKVFFNSPYLNKTRQDDFDRIWEKLATRD